MALGVDLLIAVGKLVAFLATGSVVMLAELLHSVVDVVNQGLLTVGIARSRRPADADHPYGFGRSRYVWAMLSASGVLFLGSGMALIQGAQQVLSPSSLHDLRWAFGVLLASGLAEAVSLGVGARAVGRAARDEGTSFAGYLRRGDDPTAVAVVLEDGVAVIGVLVALAALGLASLTGDARWDGVGSIVVGLLLAASALFLIDRNRALLLDPAAPSADVARVVAMLEKRPTITRILDVKSSLLGAGRQRFKAEIRFDGRAVAAKVLAQGEILERFAALEGPGDLEALLLDFGEQMVQAVGDEVDEVETELARVLPQVRHVDLEPDRGIDEKDTL